MKLKCPHAYQAKKSGCLDIKEEDRCIRREWNGVTHYKVTKNDASAKAEVYCERIRSLLHEE